MKTDALTQSLQRERYARALVRQQTERIKSLNKALNAIAKHHGFKSWDEVKRAANGEMI